MKLRLSSARIFMAVTAVALTSCSYAVETSNQDVTFLTPGAENAQCDVYIKKLRYQVFPPQTLNIRKVPDDMIVKCIAPGNRVVDMEVPSSFSKRALWGGPAGMAWDYASESMHYYPSVIAVDFSKTVATPNPLPKYHAPDVMPSDAHRMEEISPSVPMLNSDRDKPATQLIRRESMQGQNLDGTSQENPSAQEQENKSGDKGSLMSIIDRLNEGEAAETLPAPKTPIEGVSSAPAGGATGQPVPMTAE